MTIKTLERKAKLIPSMNWQTVKDKLREYASKVENGQSIVEVGTWLGACTASMMIGIRDSGNAVEIHMYDSFTTQFSQVEKASNQGIILHSGKSYLEKVNEFLDPFEVKYIPHKGDNRNCIYDSKKKIGLFVDDASKKNPTFKHTMATFSPYFIPGKTIVALLDYWYFEKKPGKGYECQSLFMEANKAHYEYLYRIENADGAQSSEAFFLFKG